MGLVKIHRMEQRSPEWHDIRVLKMSASRASVIATNGKGLVTYVNELLQDYYSTTEKETYTNSAMQYGIDMEDSAVFLYEIETGLSVENVGFIEYNEYVGMSPDGLIGDEGLIEIKSPSKKVFFELMMDEKVDPKYYAQIQMQLLISGRKWCDYVVFSADFKKQLFIKRIFPDEKVFAKLESGFKRGIELIEEGIEKLDKILK